MTDAFQNRCAIEHRRRTHVDTRVRLGTFAFSDKGHTDRMLTIVIVVLVLMLLGAIPTWPHSRSWGYAPSGGLMLVVVILIALMLTGRF
jgi:VIT1/CCC1 family predicted Fe2+/Mn2+ transporter